MIGTFQQFNSRLSQSKCAIYTEISFLAQQVIETPASSLTSGATFTVLLPGGSVSADGKTISYLIDPQQYFVQPGKQYLLILTYNASGDFYQLQKFWELSGGMAQAESKIEAARAKDGTSTITGYSLTQITQTLSQLVSFTN